jgi:hypothetical protein
MQDWPSGSHIVLETTSNGVPLIALGYKYNKRKVICFIATKGAGHTEAGVSYEAKWKDTNGNTCSRHVPRPEIASKYFMESNTIDLFNQSRQAHLKLEKQWVTEDGYFRLVTTLFGTCVTDAWKAYQYHVGNRHRHKSIEIMEFAKLLTKDLLANKYNKRIDSDDTLVLTTITIGTMVSAAAASHSISQVSELTGDPGDALLAWSKKQIALLTLEKEHSLTLCDELIAYKVGKGKKQRQGKRKKRGKCMICGNNTRHYCEGCQPSCKRKRQWCCSNDVKRQCHVKHIEAIKQEMESTK